MNARVPLGPPAILRLEELPASEGAACYLQPGQIVVAASDCRVTTILGSCVAVALHDPRRTFGGINHYLLPRGTSDSASARFGTVALPRLLREVLALGSDKSHLQAKVFGGASTLKSISDGGLGMANVELALAFLAAEHIPVVAQDVGGTRGRKLVFQTRTGIVWLKEL